MSFIDTHDFPAGLVLRVLDIPTSTYYDWRARRAEPLAARRRRAARADAGRSAPRTRSPPASAHRECGWSCAARANTSGVSASSDSGANTGLKGAYLRRGWRHGSTRQDPRHNAAPDLVERDFRPRPRTGSGWPDLTRLVTGEGVLWLASVRDAFANRIVGWGHRPATTTQVSQYALLRMELIMIGGDINTSATRQRA